MDSDIISIKKPIIDLIISNIPVFKEHEKVKEVTKILLKDVKNFDTIDYIYIVDGQKNLKGVISIKELLDLENDKTLREYTDRKLISVRVHTEQERVAMLALKNNLKEVPVIDKENKFIGVIKYDSILQIMHNEGIDNILKFGGIVSFDSSYDDISNMSVFKSIKHRLPWLIIGLLGGLLIAWVIGYFEEVLSQNLILASFIPLIVYMASAVGTQMQSFIIRDLAIKPNLEIFSYFLKQTAVITILGFIISAFMYCISYFLYDDFRISIVFFVAFICAIVSSLVTGIIVPYLFKKINLDPANASGPIATIIQDLLSVVIYFAIASVILL